MLPAKIGGSFECFNNFLCELCHQYVSFGLSVLLFSNITTQCYDEWFLYSGIYNVSGPYFKLVSKFSLNAGNIPQFTLLFMWCLKDILLFMIKFLFFALSLVFEGGEL